MSGLPEWVVFVNDVMEKKKRKKVVQRFSFGDIVMDRLRTLPDHNKIIRFPKVFHKLCSSLQITKEDAWLILMDLDKAKKIEIVRHNGIRILEN